MVCLLQRGRSRLSQQHAAAVDDTSAVAVLSPGRSPKTRRRSATATATTTDDAEATATADGSLLLLGMDGGLGCGLGLTGFDLVNGQLQQSTAVALPPALMGLFQTVVAAGPVEAVAAGVLSPATAAAIAGDGGDEAVAEEVAATAAEHDGEDGGEDGRAPVARAEEIGLMTQEGGKGKWIGKCCFANDQTTTECN